MRLKDVRLLALRDEPDAYGSTYEESERFSEQYWSRLAEEWNYYLALDGDETIGMASGGRFGPHPEARWLYGMFVRADHRGTGVAGDLVRSVAAWARSEQVTQLGLHVTTSLGRAQGFYRKLGFVPVGEPAPMERDPRLLLQTMTTDLRTNDRI